MNLRRTTNSQKFFTLEAKTITNKGEMGTFYGNWVSSFYFSGVARPKYYLNDLSQNVKYIPRHDGQPYFFLSTKEGQHLCKPPQKIQVRGWSLRSYIKVKLLKLI